MNDLDKRHNIPTTEAIQAAYEQIWKLEQSQQHIDSPEALEQLERSLREATNNLAALILQKHLQANLDSPANFDKEKELVKTCNKVTFGSCLCGLAAQKKKLQFSSCVEKIFGL